VHVVSLHNAEELRIIGEMCPLLKEAGFYEKQQSDGFLRYYSFTMEYSGLYHDQPNLSLEDIESILQKWPKVFIILS